MPVATVHLKDQLLANVACEIKVYVGNRLQIFVEKAAEEQPIADRIDVAQPDQIADDRADRRTSTSSRWQSGATPNRTLTAYVFGYKSRLLLEIAINQKEADQVVLG